MEAMKAETFYKGDNPLSFADEDHAVATMMEQETNMQQEAESSSSVAADFDGLPLFTVSDVCMEIVLSIMNFCIFHIDNTRLNFLLAFTP